MRTEETQLEKTIHFPPSGPPISSAFVAAYLVINRKAKEFIVSFVKKGRAVSRI